MQTVHMDEDSKTSYKTGSAAFIAVPVDGTPVMALLLSFQLGQRMLNCVKLQRAHGELELSSKIDITRIDKKISELQRLVDSSSMALAKAEMAKHTTEQEHQDGSGTRIIRMRERLSKAKEDISRLRREKEAIKKKEEDLKEEWYNWMEAVSLGHDDAFIKAGILPDYAKDQNEDITGRKSSEEQQPEGAGASIEAGKPREHPAKKTKGAEAEGVPATTPVIETVARKETPASKELVPYDKSNEPSEAQLLKEANIRSKLHAARKAFREAEKAHEGHRSSYNLELTKFCAQNPTKPYNELAPMFPSFFLRNGQKLIGELREAEHAYLEAERRALDANIFLIQDELIEKDVNPYLDLDELDARNTVGDKQPIYRWRHVKAGMLTPPSIHTIDTFYDASSSDDGDSAGSVVSAQDVGVQRIEDYQPSAPSANNIVDTNVATPAQDEPEPLPVDEHTPEQAVELSKPVASHYSGSSTELASTVDGAASPGVVEKRKFWGQVQGHDSFSVVDMQDKRQKIDIWQRECARWRASNLHFE
ncbi:uncharacterized protein J4E84_010655 [Alternaria hordeiaustralica]|uniref:uncharacterized protein n=1 Tax=Alternaria hordeiaustralica TaxID=1187925 RepID=UPI0020C47792|nr:uncharacterized protein J4E84_010655 [Alternaria hordeiaustralica]KAI4674280.1 hypothetical protein J4E84_010655 [Alternaria hordeiaustralica]